MSSSYLLVVYELTTDPNNGDVNTMINSKTPNISPVSKEVAPFF